MSIKPTADIDELDFRAWLTSYEEKGIGMLRSLLRLPILVAVDLRAATRLLQGFAEAG